MKDENLLSNIIIIKKDDKIQKEYLKQIILSLSNINSFTEKLLSLSKEENDVNIITLFLNFIKNNELEKDIINEIFIQIKNFEKNESLNDFRITIELVLDKMHQQLNSNESIKYIDSIEDNDKNYVFSDFKNKFNSQNNTIITNSFFGIIMKAITPDCYCKEKTYICETSKYLYLNYENIEKHDKLEDILENWGKQKLTKYECKNCATECEAEISKNFSEYPEILIIILNDSFCQKKKTVEFPIELVTSKFEYKYKLVNVISSVNKDNNLNMIEIGTEKFIAYHDDIKEEINPNEIGKWVRYPRVLFYQKNEKIDFKLDESLTEVEAKKFFEKSTVTNPLIMNDRVKNSIDYLYQISGDEEKYNELIKLEKKSNKSQLNNEIIPDKNGLNNPSGELNKQMLNKDNNESLDENLNNYLEKKNSDFIKIKKPENVINMNQIEIGNNEVNMKNNQSISTDMVMLNNPNNNCYKQLNSDSIVLTNVNPDNKKNMDYNINNNNMNIASHFNKDNNIAIFQNNNKDNNNPEFPNFNNNLNNNSINSNFNKMNNNNGFNDIYNIKKNNNKNYFINNMNNQNININNNIFNNNNIIDNNGHNNININNININNMNVFHFGNFSIYDENNNSNENFNFNNNMPLNQNIGNNNQVPINNINQNCYNINSENQFINNNLQLNQNNINNQNNLININKNVINIQISFNSGRKCFIELDNDNIPFSEVISMMFKKYEWAQRMNFEKMIFLHNGSTIYDMNKTIRQYEIRDNDIINVVQKDEYYKA